MNNNDFVQQYIAHVNTELQTKLLEVCSLKAQLAVLTDKYDLACKELDELKAKPTEEYSSKVK